MTALDPSHPAAAPVAEPPAAPVSPTEAQRRQVEALAGYGLSDDQVATLVEMDTDTMREVLARELRLGRARAAAQVAQALFRKATGEGPQSVAAAIFWTKVRLGWKETIVTESETTLRADDGIAALLARVATHGISFHRRGDDDSLFAGRGRETMDAAPGPARQAAGDIDGLSDAAIDDLPAMTLPDASLASRSVDCMATG